MDFEKIKPAVEEIGMSDELAAKILENCSGKKRKKHSKIWIPVAVAAACAAIVFSPTVFIGMKGANSAAEADSALPESGIIQENLFADQHSDTDTAMGFYTAQSTAQSAEILFECEGFKKNYGTIPFQFVSLVDSEEYESWKLTVDASDGMAMAQFVEYFGISREAFDKANGEYAFSVSGDAKAEAFNADIIYTFDRDIIDSYYADKK